MPDTSLPPATVERLKAAIQQGNPLVTIDTDVLSLLLAERERYQWQPIETAPKDGTVILGLCVHDTQTECCPEDGQCVYHYHADAIGHCEDGPHVIEYGGGDSDYDEFRGICYETPDWWFVTGTDMEQAANPTRWMPVPTAPEPLPAPGEGR